MRLFVYTYNSFDRERECFAPVVAFPKNYKLKGARRNDVGAEYQLADVLVTQKGFSLYIHVLSNTLLLYYE
jgi:hypothetical protein